MGIGDVRVVEIGDASGVRYVDTGMFDVAGYGSVYLIDAERPALIDTGIGADRERVLAALDAAGIDRADLAVIAPTHVHLDHAGGAGYLAAACPNATVAVHGIGAPHLADPGRLVEGTRRAVGDQWRFYADPEPVPEGRLRELDDGDAIDLGDRSLEVHHAPGHAPHQVVFHDPVDDLVFAGDAAGIRLPSGDGVIPTTPPPQFDLGEAVADARAIAGLDPAGICYGHFGPAPADGALEAYADTLEAWIAEVEAARDDLADDGAVVDHLVAAWLDRGELGDAWNERKRRDEVALNVRGALAYLDRR